MSIIMSVSGTSPVSFPVSLNDNLYVNYLVLVV